MASALTTSPPSRRASATARSDLPVAVGPTTAIARRQPRRFPVGEVVGRRRTGATASWLAHRHGPVASASPASTCHGARPAAPRLRANSTSTSSSADGSAAASAAATASSKPPARSSGGRPRAHRAGVSRRRARAGRRPAGRSRPGARRTGGSRRPGCRRRRGAPGPGGRRPAAQPARDQRGQRHRRVRYGVGRPEADLDVHAEVGERARLSGLEHRRGGGRADRDPVQGRGGQPGGDPGTRFPQLGGARVRPTDQLGDQQRWLRQHCDPGDHDLRHYRCATDRGAGSTGAGPDLFECAHVLFDVRRRAWSARTVLGPGFGAPVAATGRQGEEGHRR